MPRGSRFTNALLNHGYRKKDNGRNGIVEVSKNLVRYKFENNFAGPLK